MRISTSPGQSRLTAPAGGPDNDDVDGAGAASGSATTTEGAGAVSPIETTEAHRAERGRPSRWDRPPPPKDWRWWVGGLGKTLIAAGLLLLGFVAYQLWGTGIETARAQRALEQDFEEMLAAAPVVTAPAVDEPVPADPTPTTAVDDAVVDGDADTGADIGPGSTAADGSTPADQSTGTDPLQGTAVDDVDGRTADAGSSSVTDAGFDGGVAAAVPLAQQNIPELTHGDALARLQIPSIGVDDIVVAGVQPDDLKKGPGHFPETPLPGQLGNSAIAGHRTTYGQPFYDIDQLQPGDDIVVTTLNGQYIYVVSGQQIVSPDDYQVVTTTDRTVATLTLTSCHPRWTARQRIVVSALLDTRRSSPVGEALLGYDADAEPDEPDAAATSEPTLPTESVAPEAEASTDTVSERVADDAVATTTPVEPAIAEASHAEIAGAFADGWFSDPAAFPQVALWGAVLIMIWALGYLLSHRARRYWVGVAAAILPFVVVLYFFYQNVNRLLPPNL